MPRTGFILIAVGLVLAALWCLFAAPEVGNPEVPDSPAAVERGRYLVAAGGCVSCHEGTAHADSLSGGLALESDFGTFYAPNITPDNETGIGGWTGADFLLALRHGRAPDGGFYYPAFPYPAYAGMKDQDVLDIAAYLKSLPPVEFSAPAHELPPWLFRWTIAGWNLLASLLNPEPPEEDEPLLARGAYLARHLGHCGECHTPRNGLGIPDLRREFAGGVLPDGEVEAIDAPALADWSAQDFVLLLSLGLKPDGEFVGGKMEPVVEHNTSRLTSDDQKALAAFFIRR
ncbi:MAG: cytochrome c [Pseudomonadales bacterium]